MWFGNIVKDSAKRIGVAKFAPHGRPVLGSAILRDASWSRSNFFWGTFRCKRLKATLAANSGFGQPSMVALGSSRILELGVELWKGCRRSDPSP
jgi:hypothetical protein